MAEPIKACIDVALPTDRRDTAALQAIGENPVNFPAIPVAFGSNNLTPLALVRLTGKFWRSGRVLRVRFLNGDPVVQGRIQLFAHEWEQYANIQFAFGQDPNAEIRIAVQPGGSWSYVGTDALAVPSEQPTLNFGWLTPHTPDDEFRSIVLHEFGHVLGLTHEH